MWFFLQRDKKHSTLSVSFLLYSNMHLSKLKSNKSNPRNITAEKIDSLKRSIKSFPEMMELRPIIIDEDYVVLGGNMRLLAIKALGYKEIPDNWVRQINSLTEEQKGEFIIKDNASFGTWDAKLLLDKWNKQELIEWGVDLKDWNKGLELEEIDLSESPISEQEGVEGDAEIQVGTLIELRTSRNICHRIICGDSLNKETLSKLVGSDKIQALVTDPPYEIEVNYDVISSVISNSHVFIFQNDRAIIKQLQRSPFSFKKFHVFYHPSCAIPQEGGNEVFLDHILISHEVAGKPEVRYNKGNGTRTVIKGEYRKDKIHKHAKPLNVLEPLIKGYSDQHGIVLDLFAGGGSTTFACQQLNRSCYSIEIDPNNCRKIVNKFMEIYPNTDCKITQIDV